MIADVFEQGPLRDVTGITIRPGGLMLTERAVQFCNFNSDVQLLDVGCGVGATVEFLSSHCGFTARGIDISPKLIAEGLNRNPLLELTEAAAEKLPFAGESQDGILCECVLSLLKEPLRALMEFKRVLRSGSYLVLSDMYTRELAGVTGSDTCHRGALHRLQIEELLTECGLVPLLWEDHTHLLKELAARLILANGSLEGLSCEMNGSGLSPGYYLLIARKQDKETTMEAA